MSFAKDDVDNQTDEGDQHLGNTYNTKQHIDELHTRLIECNMMYLIFGKM